MKNIIRLAVTLGLGAFTSLAQQNGGGQGGPPGGPHGMRHPPMPPVMKVLDADSDGELSTTEIANASASLLQLDVNGDSKLSRDELRPQGHGGHGGHGGPGGPGGPDGPDDPGAPGDAGPPPEQ